jgi:uncharacterized YigZ family protein
LNYFSVLDYSEAEQVVEKSRFITYTKPVYDENEAAEFIARIKKLNYDASHNVSAYVIGESSDIKRYSDDGEPSGTAGMPMLDVMLKKGITNTCVVITRYFGGIKLGTGGLVRAYTESTKMGLEASKIVEYREMRCYSITCTYDLAPKIQYRLKGSDVIIKDTEYLEKVRFLVYVKEDEMKILDELIDITSSLIYIEEKDNVFVRFCDDRIID